MIRYLGRRLLETLPVVLGISLIVFLLLRLVPGDPVRIMLGERANPDQVERVRHELGLDRPWPVQYFEFMRRAVQLDLGRSIKRNSLVTEELARAFPATLELTLAAVFLATLVGVGLGTLAALKRNSWADALCTAISLSGISIPIFWLGLCFILIFPVGLGWFHFSGRTDFSFDTVTGLYLIDSLLAGRLDIFWDVLSHLILPAVTLATVPTAMIARMTRSALLEVLGQDYIRTARAKGLGPRAVLFGHALPNAMLPIVTVVGLQFGYLLGGAVLTETVFQWPGLGVLLLEAVKERDYPLVQGSILLIAISFSLVNLAVDLAYAFFDPRVRYE